MSLCQTANMNDAKQPEPAESDFLGNMGAIAMVAYYAPMLIAFGDAAYTLFHQTRDWLKSGHWVPHDLWEAVAYWFGVSEQPHLGWVVPDRVLWWILSSSRWFSMAVIGIALAAFETWSMIALFGGYEKTRIAKNLKDKGSEAK